MTESNCAEDAYRVKDNQISTLSEQLAGQFTEIIDLKAEIAEQAAQELRLAEATSRADEEITTLKNLIAIQSTEIDNLNARVATMAAQEQQATKAFAEKEVECSNSKKKWYDLELAQLALESRFRECE